MISYKFRGFKQSFYINSEGSRVSRVMFSTPKNVLHLFTILIVNSTVFNFKFPDIVGTLQRKESWMFQNSVCDLITFQSYLYFSHFSG